MSNTTFTLVEERYEDYERWLISVVDGELADAVRARSGLSGEVRVWEREYTYWYSEYTADDEWAIRVTVGDKEVWTMEDAIWPLSQESSRDSYYSSLGHFLKWVEETE